MPGPSKFNMSCPFGLLYVWAVLNLPCQDWTFRNKFDQVFPYHVIIPLNLSWKYHIIASHSKQWWRRCDKHVIQSQSDHMFTEAPRSLCLSPSREYTSRLFASCVALIESPLKHVFVEVCPCPKQRVQKLQIAYFCGCVPLRMICILWGYYCIRFVCGLEHLGINTLRSEKLQCAFVTGRALGCLNGVVSRNNRYILRVCVCVSKSCKTCWRL